MEKCAMTTRSADLLFFNLHYIDVQHRRQIVNADVSARLSVNCVFPLKESISFSSSVSARNLPSKGLCKTVQTKDVSRNRIQILVSLRWHYIKLSDKI